MSYTDSLLAQGEVVAMRSKQHWLAILLDGRNALAIWLVAVLLFAATTIFNIQGQARDILGIIVLALFVIGLVVIGWQWIQWLNADYLVTNRRVLQVGGVINKKSMDSSLEKVNDAVLEENLLGRMLDYGDLDILTASEAAIDRFRMLKHAKAFKKEMLEQKHELEQGDFYRPSPPMMASAPVAAAAAPMPAPAAAAPAPVPEPAAAPTYEPAAAPTYEPPPGFEPPASPVPAETETVAAATGSTAGPASGASVDEAAELDEDEARDVTRTLARLADLRDRGAITAEDYEAKKQELLGRL
jgi:hypothetical protein